jgi:NADH-quinone oxidoreductase subunit N
MDENAQPIEKISIPLMPKLALYTCIAGILAVGFISYIYDYIHSLSGGM